MSSEQDSETHFPELEAGVENFTRTSKSTKANFVSFKSLSALLLPPRATSGHGSIDFFVKYIAGQDEDLVTAKPWEL